MDWLEHTWSAVKSFALAPATMIVLTVVSVLCCIASFGVATWAVRRLPEDYLLHEPNGDSDSTSRVRLVLRNVLGGVLLVLGVLMLVLPGQGVLTMVAALAVMNFRSKRRLQQRLLGRPHVLALANRLRRRSGKPPLQAPEAAQKGEQKASKGAGTRPTPFATSSER